MPYGDLLADVVQGSTANTPPVFKDGNGTTIGTLCRAWVNFNGTGTVAIRASFNVSSITDNGTGNYTVNFTTAMPDANYAGVGNGRFATTGGNAAETAAIALADLATTSVRVWTSDGASPNNAEDEALISVAIFR
jgi:hypothetical protein